MLLRCLIRLCLYLLASHPLLPVPPSLVIRLTAKTCSAPGVLETICLPLNMETRPVISPTRRMFDQVSCRYVRASTRSQRESIPDGEIDKAAPRLAQHAVHWQMRRKPVKEMAIVRNKSFVDRPSRACFSFGPFFFTRLRAESRFLGFDARSRGWLCP